MIATAVVAHRRRRQQAEQLAETVGAVLLSVDDGTLGCNGSHIAMWKQMADHKTDWTVILEDDAEPVDGFLDQLHQVLSVAPEPIVSLYLGTGRPHRHQRLIRSAIQRADEADAHWITSPDLIHAVAVCIRTSLIPDMLATLNSDPIDDAISHWAPNVAYTFPSLVDHQDGFPVLRHQYEKWGEPIPARKAWRTGTRDVWNNVCVPM